MVHSGRWYHNEEWVQNILHLIQKAGRRHPGTPTEVRKARHCETEAKGREDSDSRSLRGRFEASIRGSGEGQKARILDRQERHPDCRLRRHRLLRKREESHHVREEKWQALLVRQHFDVLDEKQPALREYLVESEGEAGARKYVGYLDINSIANNKGVFPP